jgi:ATP-dependent RNA helicase RhlE
MGHLRFRDPKPRAANPGGQPDPLRTSIDAMRTGNRNKKPGGGNPGGGGKGNNKGPRTPGGGADPLRTSYGRIS